MRRRSSRLAVTRTSAVLAFLLEAAALLGCEDQVRVTIKVATRDAGAPATAGAPHARGSTGASPAPPVSR